MSLPRAQASTEGSGALLPLLEALPPLEADERNERLRVCVSAWRERRLVAARERFEREGHALKLLAEISGIMDETISALFKLLIPTSLGVAVIATGGYGRQEMFPYSDVDLLFLYRPAARNTANLA